MKHWIVATATLAMMTFAVGAQANHCCGGHEAKAGAKETSGTKSADCAKKCAKDSATSGSAEKKSDCGHKH